MPSQGQIPLFSVAVLPSLPVALVGSALVLAVALRSALVLHPPSERLLDAVMAETEHYKTKHAAYFSEEGLRRLIVKFLGVVDRKMQLVEHALRVLKNVHDVVEELTEQPSEHNNQKAKELFRSFAKKKRQNERAVSNLMEQLRDIETDIELLDPDDDSSDLQDQRQGRLRERKTLAREHRGLLQALFTSIRLHNPELLAGCGNQRQGDASAKGVAAAESAPARRRTSSQAHNRRNPHCQVPALQSCVRGL